MCSKMEFVPVTPHVGWCRAATNIGVIADRLGETHVLYVIDSGTSANDGRALLALLGSRFPQARLRAVINTHSHADHCGANGFLRKETGCEVWATHGEAALMEVPVLQPSLVYGGSPPAEIAVPRLMAEACTVDVRLCGGEPIPLGDAVTLTPIPLPGHYLDMAGFLVADAATGMTVAFLADAISGRDALRRYWIQYLYDEGLCKQSLTRIRSLRADCYVPGHGEAVSEIEGLVELNLLAMLETEAMILDELSRPMTAEEVLKAVADRNQITLHLTQHQLIGSTVRSYLSSMRRDGSVVCVVQNNRLLWQRAETVSTGIEKR